jgi:CDP-diacylglycerol--glycerol-3-phosphate 3-phosphatidyltransferase
VSDLLDGIVARRQGIVSDLGKVLDPFADVIGHLTFFLVFAAFGIVPFWMFLLLMYREIGIIFVRILMIRRGTALAARRGGKIKTALYALGSLIGLVSLTDLRLRNLGSYVIVDTIPRLPWYTMGVFLLMIIAAWVSFIDYLSVLRRKES